MSDKNGKRSQPRGFRSLPARGMRKNHPARKAPEESQLAYPTNGKRSNNPEVCDRFPLGECANNTLPREPQEKVESRTPRTGRDHIPDVCDRFLLGSAQNAPLQESPTNNSNRTLNERGTITTQRFVIASRSGGCAKSTPPGEHQDNVKKYITSYQYISITNHTTIILTTIITIIIVIISNITIIIIIIIMTRICI